MTENYSFAWEPEDEKRHHNPMFSEGFDAGYGLMLATKLYEKEQPLWQMGYVKGAYHRGRSDGELIHGEGFRTPANSGYRGNGFEDDYRNGFEPGSLASEAYNAGFITGRTEKVAVVDAFNSRVERNRKLLQAGKRI